MYNVSPAKQMVVAGTIDPQSATTAKSTGWISMVTYAEILAILSVGTISASGTVDAKLEQAQDGSGTGVKDVPSRAMTQLTQAATNSNEQVAFVCRHQDLDAANNFAFVRLTVTPATAAALISAVVLGLNARYEPATAATSFAQAVGS